MQISQELFCVFPAARHTYEAAVCYTDFHSYHMQPLDGVKDLRQGCPILRHGRPRACRISFQPIATPTCHSNWFNEWTHIQPERKEQIVQISLRSDWLEWLECWLSMARNWAPPLVYGIKRWRFKVFLQGNSLGLQVCQANFCPIGETIQYLFSAQNVNVMD